MRYLRMLSNSVIAAGVASGYLTALVLQLNPSVSIEPGDAAAAGHWCSASPTAPTSRCSSTR